MVIFALAEVLVTNLPFRVDEVVSWPRLIMECVPDRIIVIQGNWIRDAKLVDCLLNIRQLFLDVELRRVDADHYEATVFVFFCPRPNIRNGADAVDAGVVPKIDEDNLPF